MIWVFVFGATLQNHISDNSTKIFVGFKQVVLVIFGYPFGKIGFGAFGNNDLMKNTFIDITGAAIVLHCVSQ